MTALLRRPPASSLEPPAGGFTLIELIVSMTVSVGIVAGAYLCLKGGMESRKLCEQRMDIAQNARVALALLTADLASACSFDEEHEFVGMRRTLGGMDADNLDFATHNWRPRSPGEGDLCEVSYFVDKDRRTGELSLWRRRDPSPDDDPMDGGSREEIAVGIAGFRLEYSDGFEWYENWGAGDLRRDRVSTNLSSYDMGGLPEAVRATIAFEVPGDPFNAAAAGAGERSRESYGRRPGGGPAEPSPAWENGPPPLLFQTVVRLNLAARAAEKYSRETGDSSSPGNSTTGEPASAGEGK